MQHVNGRRLRASLIALCTVAFTSTAVVAGPRPAGAPPAAPAPAAATSPSPTPTKKDSGNTTTYVGKDSTNIDFSAANIDGKMMAPNGFFLQGRNAQSMSQMVKLRAKFRSELRDSKAAVKALIH